MAENSFKAFAIIPQNLVKSYGDNSFFDTITYAHNNAISQFPEKAQASKERDAYRHLLWLGMMTQKYGEKHARMAGNLHESRIPFVGSPFQSNLEKDMDLYNNELGIQLGKSTKSLEELMQKAKEMVLQKEVKLSNTSGTY